MCTNNMPPLPYEAFDHSNLTGEQWVALWHAYAEQETKALQHDIARHIEIAAIETNRAEAAEQQIAALRAELRTANDMVNIYRASSDSQAKELARFKFFKFTRDGRNLYYKDVAE